MSYQSLSLAYAAMARAAVLEDSAHRSMAASMSERDVAEELIKSANLMGGGMPVYAVNKPMCVFVGGPISGKIRNIDIDTLSCAKVGEDGGEESPHVPAIVVGAEVGVVSAMMVPEGRVRLTLLRLASMDYTQEHGELIRLLVLTFGTTNVTPVIEILKDLRSAIASGASKDETPVFIATTLGAGK